MTSESKAGNRARSTGPQARFAKCDAAWLQLPLAGRDLRVLLALSLHADWRPEGLGRCYPKRDTLALTTNLQVSHVSEGIRALAEDGIITVVRLGRKNVYYVREIGSTDRMPPSDAEPFFAHLRHLGIRIVTSPDAKFIYAPGSRKFEEFPKLLRAIFSDYVNGLTPTKFETALGLLAPDRSAT